MWTGLSVGEDGRLTRRIEAEFAGVCNWRFATGVSMLLAEVADSGVLEHRRVFLLLFFVFCVQVF